MATIYNFTVPGNDEGFLHDVPLVYFVEGNGLCRIKWASQGNCCIPCTPLNPAHCLSTIYHWPWLVVYCSVRSKLWRDKKQG